MCGLMPVGPTAAPGADPALGTLNFHLPHLPSRRSAGMKRVVPVGGPPSVPTLQDFVSAPKRTPAWGSEAKASPLTKPAVTTSPYSTRRPLSSHTSRHPNKAKAQEMFAHGMLDAYRTFAGHKLAPTPSAPQLLDASSGRRSPQSAHAESSACTLFVVVRSVCVRVSLAAGSVCAFLRCGGVQWERKRMCACNLGGCV